MAGLSSWPGLEEAAAGRKALAEKAPEAASLRKPITFETGGLSLGPNQGGLSRAGCLFSVSVSDHRFAASEFPCELVKEEQLTSTTTGHRSNTMARIYVEFGK